MHDKALENAKRRLNQLLSDKDRARQTLAKLDEQIERAEAFIHNYEYFFEGNFESESLPVETVENETRTPSQRPRDNSSKEEVAAAARDIIEAEGRPVPRPRLLAELTDRGLRIEGADREKVLSTMLWRMNDQIVHFRKAGYWLADRPWLEANYDPANPDNRAMRLALEEAEYERLGIVEGNHRRAAIEAVIGDVD